MSMITSVLSRKQNQSQNRKGGADGGRTTAGGGGTEGEEPLKIDILEPLMDAISQTALPAPSLGAVPQFATPSMDWKETPTAHVFVVDLPGVRRDEVKVEVAEEKMLKISGQRLRAGAEDKQGDRWRRVERGSERFVRTVRLPPNANTENVQAALGDGVLTVTIPKDNDRKAYGRLVPITN
uniref:Heat shock protein 18.9 n=1 Tax=Zoysia japonica TaxID=309978 RepID=A0A678W501_9POAL|nr:heat shock protein 18.9 [Zoysia japonica]